MAAASKKLAAAAVLVSLLALLVGPSPSAGLLASGPGCTIFVGWQVLPSFKAVICVLLGGNNYTPPEPSPAKELSYGYYSNPDNTASYCQKDVEVAVRDVVKDAIAKQGRGIGAGLIRLFFHDAFVRGCDASVLLKSTLAAGSNTEMEGPPNKDSLRGFEVIDAAKEATKAACGGRNVVSCADILALAARDASRILSDDKINYTVPTGRLDVCQSFATDTNTLPGPDSTFKQLVEMFEAQGLSAADMVTLSGAHSIGKSRCLFFKKRRAENATAMDPYYAARLRAACGNSDDIRVDQDPFTPDYLDNRYYKNIDKFVLFNSDAVLISDETAKKQVEANVANATKWEEAFGEAMKKMGNIGVKTTLVRGVTEIREFCWKVNGASY